MVVIDINQLFTGGHQLVMNSHLPATCSCICSAQHWKKAPANYSAASPAVLLLMRKKREGNK